MRTDSNKNETLKGYLETLCKCYSTGRFENLFPLLADDCVFESQWVLTPNTGKSAVVDYFQGKGATLRKNNCCPTCTIVEFVGNLNTIKNAEVHLNGGEAQRASLGLWYPDGKLAMLMCQTLNDVTNGVIVDLQLDENDLISQIDLCMPELFNFKHFAGPFEIEDEEDICEAEYKKGLSLLEGHQTEDKIHRAYDIMGNLASQFDYVPAIMWMGDFAENTMQNAGQAVFWYKKAADMGDGNGARCYADMLMTGKGVARNPQQAMHYYADAADKGVPEAAFVLGEFLRNSGDRENAIKAYKQALAGGYQPASIRLQQMGV